MADFYLEGHILLYIKKTKMSKKIPSIQNAERGLVLFSRQSEHETRFGLFMCAV
jgi:hypothetical protein